MESTINQHTVIKNVKSLLMQERFIHDQKKTSNLVKVFSFLLGLLCFFTSIVFVQLYLTDLELLKNIISTTSSKLLLFPIELVPIIVIAVFYLMHFRSQWNRVLIKPIVLSAFIAVVLSIVTSNYIILLNNNPVRQLALSTIQKTELNSDFGALARLEKIGENSYLATIIFNNKSTTYSMNNPKIIPSIGTNIWLKYSENTIIDMGVISTNKVF
jgi:hypothetical protein